MVGPAPTGQLLVGTLALSLLILYLPGSEYRSWVPLLIVRSGAMMLLLQRSCYAYTHKSFFLFFSTYSRTLQRVSVSAFDPSESRRYLMSSTDNLWEHHHIHLRIPYMQDHEINACVKHSSQPVLKLNIKILPIFPQQRLNTKYKGTDKAS